MRRRPAGRQARAHDFPTRLRHRGDRVIVARDLTKTYGRKVAVDAITFGVEPGRVTGFLGPNGAGKSTTMRMILGLDRPSSGSVSVNGHRYQDSPAPLREVGALLEARALHPGRSARDHLRWLAVSNRIPVTRVDEVLGLVGLEAVAGQRSAGSRSGWVSAWASPWRCSATLLPGSWGEWTAKLLPGNAGSGVATPVSFNPNLLGPWAGFAVFLGEVAVLLAVAHLTFRRRDV
jgi:ABC-type uncharacterized transport system fused permease/ATPase subunit